MNYWLFKTEPNTYSIDDLKNEPNKITHWDGIRNYAARNFLRDEVKKGDLVLIYHSVVKPPQLVGVAKVVKEAYPDHTAFDANSHYFDPKSKKDNPTWVMVDIEYVRHLDNPVTLDQIRNTPTLENMVLLKNSRLSIQPVTSTEWSIITEMAKD
ncbi:MAG: EVE domain-containing protein [Deferribacteres bacterium]|nr:EVE domain-containing protein [candidate division KSB1 bacterium]MCB9510550.1 EVE domain-containing protein [Deferribacteres bacterium]